MNKAPIFIHSLFRTGSTYLFNVFRSSAAGYWCYQEPLHEAVINANDNPGSLLKDHGDSLVQQLRHPRIETPYFQELHDTWPAWRDALSATAIYNGYFASPNVDIGIPYFRALVEAAKGRPVFQECRTASRISAIREQLDGYHVYLWRNPWDQWWSYKVARYFDVANQLIINAPNPPLPIEMLRNELGFGTSMLEDIDKSFEHFWGNPLSAEESYLVFYMIWCLGFSEGIKHAHLMMNIDRLSDSPTYRDEMQTKLAEAGIDGINFSDCRVPHGRYLDQDQFFFTELEDKVHNWLMVGGWSQDEVNQVLSLRRQFQPANWSEPITVLSPQDMAEQASRARTQARRTETSAAVTARECAARVIAAETLVTQADARLAELHNSTSWKLTAPIRALGRVVRRK